jgi:hypothetical protein
MATKLASGQLALVDGIDSLGPILAISAPSVVLIYLGPCQHGFLKRGGALAMLVPNVVVPQERNALINVRHSDMARVRLVSEEPFRFDPRLLELGAR